MKGYGAYQGIRVEGASPLGLVLLSHEALFKQLGLARRAIEAGDMEAEATHTARAMEAIVELASSLNLQEGGAIATGLATLYAYMMKRLGESMCSGSTEAIENVMDCVRILREGWQELSSRETGTSQPKQRVATA